MGTLYCIIFVVFLTRAAFAASYPCPSASYVDTGSLPSAPVFPTNYLSSTLTPSPSSSNPLTQGHWSEVSNLAAYRPPKVTPVANPPQTYCPHTPSSGLKNWHDPATWGSSGIPTAKGANIVIPANTAVLISSCSIDPNVVFGTITVPATSKLIFADANINMSASGFSVYGAMYAGNETCRLRNQVTITLYGQRSAQTLPADPSVKGIAVYGSLDLHGAQYVPTWTRLAMTAKINDTWIFVQDLVNWQPGQTIVITTTELKDSRDWHRNEERKIVSVMRTTLGAAVSAIQIDQPLSYLHFGGTEYQAEVALLSRNILVQGDPFNSDPTDTANVACTDPSDGSTYPCENTFITGFGAVITMLNGTGLPSPQGRFAGVEMYRSGQTNVLGRYSIHYHMLGNLSSYDYTTAYISDCSVHHSYFRCYAIHGTQGVLLTQNTAYDVIGHCYFLEDGVEEDNILSYNQAAHIHPLGPYQNPSLEANGDSWWAQYLSTYYITPQLLLPSDMAAGCFYFTNTYNDVYGNAASGGWTGFAMPALPLPVKLSINITNMSPANRPFRTPFRGNSAHSTGYWWQTAGGIYVGGELSQPGGVLQYTSGRSATHDTCADKTAGTPGADQAGCYNVADQLWLRFEDNKVFLANRGLQDWGERAEIIRFEMHDVSLSMNVFGQVWIDQMLMECRSSNHAPTWFSACPSAPKMGSNGWSCNNRDSSFWTNFGGFQWYDTGQKHILTNSVFRNCRNDWQYCTNGPSKGVCGGIAVFTSLTHSDEFIPELMQVTSNITYQNVTDLWRYSTAITDSEGITVSGRCQNWYDADGSASLDGKRTMIGSGRAADWWKINSNCVLYDEAWKCDMAPGDSSASMVIHHNATWEAQIGGPICVNGNPGGYPCPVIGHISRFGSTNESAGFTLAVNGKMSGPLVAATGGWFIRITAGTPTTLSFDQIQVAPTDFLLLAIPYPAGTTFSIYYEAASWCSTAWANCTHYFHAVTSLTAVVNAYGDAYYWDNNGRTLYVRLVQTAATFPYRQDPQIWASTSPSVQWGEVFARGGQSLVIPADTTVYIKASCSSNPCAPQPTVAVPAAFNVLPYLPTPTPAPTTSTTGAKSTTGGTTTGKSTTGSSATTGSKSTTTTGK